MTIVIASDEIEAAIATLRKLAKLVDEGRVELDPELAARLHLATWDVLRGLIDRQLAQLTEIAGRLVEEAS